jgi:hypothetical protein
MSYRVCRHLTSSTFKVNNQLCKVFLEPQVEYRPGHWLWNVGFAVGRSKRQLNDWYWKRKNKRRRSLDQKIVGTSGIKTISKGFKEVLKLRWNIEPGDVICLDCTSGNPEKQFKTWMRWAPSKKHPEWLVDFQEKKFFWYRPPYPDDAIWNQFRIQPVVPADPLENTADSRYYGCFRIEPKVPCTDLSMDQTLALLGQVLNS